METLTWALQVDERYFTPSNLQFMYLVVGQVSTNAFPRNPDPLRPDSDTFAKAVVHKIGCGKRRIAPYLGHAVSHWFAEALGEDLGEWTVAQAMKQLFSEESKMK
jgi:17beta-estradiol 17-dehydrogenase / very-long-chain 3-oxoacyl-CoA reductase